MIWLVESMDTSASNGYNCVHWFHLSSLVSNEVIGFKCVHWLQVRSLASSVPSEVN